MSDPEVSIIMPAYNAGKFIRASIQSILDQSYTNFELIISDDNSTDDTLEIAESFGDSRIRIIRNSSLGGIVINRNRALEHAHGDFIAPFDADDIAHPEKFSRQIAFMHKNPHIGLLGTWAKLIDQDGQPMRTRWKLNATSKRIPPILLFRNYFVHSSLLIRRNAWPSGRYREDHELVEDYDMVLDVAEHHAVWNYPSYLTHYRIHSGSATQQIHAPLQQYDKLIFNRLMNQLQIDTSEEDFLLWYGLKRNEQPLVEEPLHKTAAFLDRIYQQNREINRYQTMILARELFNRWLKSVYLFRHLSRRESITFISQVTAKFWSRTF